MKLPRLWHRESITPPYTVSESDRKIAAWHHLSVNAWLRLPGESRVHLRDVYWNHHTKE